VGAPGEDAVPVAGGIDFLLEKLLRQGAGGKVVEVGSAASSSRADAATASVGGLEITCRVEGAEVSVVGPTGKRLKGKAPGKGKDLQPGKYKVQVTRPGHEKSEEGVWVEPGFDALLRVFLFPRSPDG